MARRRKAEKRETILDLKYNNKLIGLMINHVMRKGKKSKAEAIVYGMLDFVKEQAHEDPLTVVVQAIDNMKPKVEVRSRRVGGATYQVPVEVSTERQTTLSLRWLIQFAKARKGVPIAKALGMELLDAFKNQGNVIRKRDDTYKMAQANKAFAHYKW